jgi:hypothetical protein
LHIDQTVAVNVHKGPLLGGRMRGRRRVGVLILSSVEDVVVAEDARVPYRPANFARERGRKAPDLAQFQQPRWTEVQVACAIAECAHDARDHVARLRGRDVRRGLRDSD